MVNKKTFFAFALLAVVLMGAISLAGCGTSSPAGGGGAPAVVLPAYYVNAAVPVASAASATGTLANPFKTITAALTVASTAAVAANIYVAPGTYNVANGEVFPLTLSNGINLIGDIANKGVGAASTTIQGDAAIGNYTLAGVGVKSGAWGVVVVVPANVTGASIKGLNIGGGWDYDILVDKATATIDSNTTTIMAGAAGNDLGVFNTSTVVITNNVFSDDSWYAHLEIVDNAVATVKNNIFAASVTNWDSNIRVQGLSTAATSPTVNMGTVGAPGGNTILGGTAIVGLYVLDVASTSTINVSGNTWKPNVQTADAAGHYTAGLLISASSVPYTAGNNYAIVNATAGNPGLQFYGTGTATHPKKK